jgi:hypothetical protein
VVEWSATQIPSIVCLLYHMLRLIVITLARAETLPILSSTVPFRRDPDFVDRPELGLLQQRLACPAARVALFGIGGVG